MAHTHVLSLLAAHHVQRREALLAVCLIIARQACTVPECRPLGEGRRILVNAFKGMNQIPVGLDVFNVRTAIAALPRLLVGQVRLHIIAVRTVVPSSAGPIMVDVPQASNVAIIVMGLAFANRFVLLLAPQEPSVRFGTVTPAYP